MKVFFFPIKNKNNKYIEIVTNILKNGGVDLYDFKSNLTNILFKSNDKNIIWLNWYEVSKGFMFFKRLIIFFLLKINSNNKIIWVMHNRYPHNKTIFSNFMYYLMVKYSDIIIIHSNISENILIEKYGEIISKKIRYIPHPNYIGEYGCIDDNIRENKNLKLLFIGLVRPYKNVELLIKAISEFRKEDVELVIAGYPETDLYRMKLLNLSEGRDNIKFIFKFIEDYEISGYLSSCDLLILPYNLDSSLNSGTVMLSFSYAKTLICPRIGTLLDMESSNFLSYSYTNEREHLRKLIEKIEKAIMFKKEDKNIFVEWGNVMLNEVSNKNSKDKIQQLIIETLNKI